MKIKPISIIDSHSGRTICHNMTGQELKKIKLKLGKTNRELAEFFSVTERTFARWISGDVPVPPYVYRIYELEEKVMDLQCELESMR